MADQLTRGQPKTSHHDSNRAARAATLGPNATNDWTKTLAWTEHALTRLAEIEKARPNLKDLILRERHSFLNTRGAVLFRAGRFQEAAEVLQEAMRVLSDGGEVRSAFFGALVEARLGHAEAALKATAKARRALSGPKPASVWEQAEIELLAAELDAAMPLPHK